MDSQFRCLCDLALKSLFLSIRDRSCYFYLTNSGRDEIIISIYLGKIIITKSKLNFLCGIGWRYFYIQTVDFIVVISYQLNLRRIAGKSKTLRCYIWCWRWCCLGRGSVISRCLCYRRLLGRGSLGGLFLILYCHLADILFLADFRCDTGGSGLFSFYLTFL